MAKQPASPAVERVVSFAHQPPLITILADHATQDRAEHLLGDDPVAILADKDQLDLQARLASTFDILRHRNTRCPLAIAVYGDWGTGKTSAMRWLETRLHEWNSVDAPKRNGHPRAYPVWFDPWRYHSKEEVWRGIIAEVILALFRVGHLDHQNVLPRMVQAVKKFGGFLGRSFIHAVANLKLSTPGVPGLPGLEASGEMFRDIWEEYDKAAQPHKAHLNQFEDTLRTWVTDFLGPQAPSDIKAANVTRVPDRLVLFIDDLDRCLPEVTLEVIEALKLYLNIDHLVFVVGLDETVVRSVVAEHYKKAGVDPSKAARYLDKVFQVDLRIPPSEAAMEDYLQSQVAALNEATDDYWEKNLQETGRMEDLHDAISALARNNPREIKRLLNSAFLRGHAAALIKCSGEEDGRLRFAQGVQTYLLQRFLGERHLQSENLLLVKEHLDWLAGASRSLTRVKEAGAFTIEELVEELLERHQNADKKAAAGRLSADGDAGAPQNGMDQAAAIEALYQHLNTKPPTTDPGFWMGRAFLTLMQIPFEPHVAAQIPPARSRAAVPTLAASRNPLPDYLLERLAWAADRPVHALQPAHWQKIESLDLSGTPVTTQALRRVHGAPRLSILKLRGCTHLTDTSGLAAFRLLEHVVLEGCTGLRGKEAFKGLAELPSLQKLDLDDCTGLEETSFLAGLHRLQRLDLDGCTGLKDNAAFEGVRHLLNLEKLYLCGCTGLKNISVLAGLDKLQKLDLTNCTGLVGDDALAGAALLRGLTELDISGCTGIQSLSFLAGMTQLKELDLSRCTGLKGSAAFQGLAGLPWLETLDLQACTGLDEETLAGLRRQFPASCTIFGPDGKRVEK